MGSCSTLLLFSHVTEYSGQVIGAQPHDWNPEVDFLCDSVPLCEPVLGALAAFAQVFTQELMVSLCVLRVLCVKIPAFMPSG